MKKNFITPVSMVCTQEQYKRDLRSPLLEMGYSERCDNFDNYPLLVNNCDDYLGLISDSSMCLRDALSRHFIDHYNPELFLALAAMTDDSKGISEEYRKLVTSMGNDFIKVKDFSNIQITLAISGEYSTIRKATKEELIKHFNKNKLMEKIDLREYLCSGNIVTFNNGEKGVVIETQVGEIISTQNNVVMSIELWDEDLEVKSRKDLRIEQIEQIQQNSSSNLYLIQSKEVWRRRPRYTLNELVIKAGLETGRFEVELPDGKLIIL